MVDAVELVVGELPAPGMRFPADLVFAVAVVAVVVAAGPLRTRFLLAIAATALMMFSFVIQVVLRALTATTANTTRT